MMIQVGLLSKDKESSNRIACDTVISSTRGKLYKNSQGQACFNPHDQVYYGVSFVKNITPKTKKIYANWLQDDINDYILQAQGDYDSDQIINYLAFKLSTLRRSADFDCTLANFTESLGLKYTTQKYAFIKSLLVSNPILIEEIQSKIKLRLVKKPAYIRRA